MRINSPGTTQPIKKTKEEGMQNIYSQGETAHKRYVGLSNIPEMVLHLKCFDSKAQI